MVAKKTKTEEKAEAKNKTKEEKKEFHKEKIIKICNPISFSLISLIKLTPKRNKSLLNLPSIVP